MKHALFLTALCLAAGAASAETKRSSRNLESLSKRAGAPAQEAPAGATAKVSFLGPKSGWGFVKTNGPFYSPEGRRLGTLPGGTPFKYTAVKTSSKNDVLVSTVRRGDTWDGPYLLDCTDVVGYEGDPESLDPAVVKNLAEYFTLAGKIAARKEALEQEALAANPHYEPAKQAQQAYLASVEKAAEMEKQMNALTGPRKSKAVDALRAFKYEQVRIKTKADQTALAYKAWKEAHPADPSKRAPDLELAALAQELQAARAKVDALVPKAE